MTSPLGEAERKAFAADPFGDMFKLVVDVHRDLVTVGGDFHAVEKWVGLV